MIYLVVFCLELVNLLIFNSCFVNTDMSKLQGGSSGGDEYGYSSLSLSFWIFLAIAGLEFWVFYWVCWGFFLFGFVEVFVQFFFFLGAK